jgi:hypothetical protein
VAFFNYVAKILHLVDNQQLSIVGPIFLLGLVELHGAEGCSTAPMAEVEASVTFANGADGSGCVNRVARDKLALQSS